MASKTELPDELWGHITGFLPTRDAACKMRLLSRTFAENPYITPHVFRNIRIKDVSQLNEANAYFLSTTKMIVADRPSKDDEVNLMFMKLLLTKVGFNSLNIHHHLLDLALREIPELLGERLKYLRDMLVTNFTLLNHPLSKEEWDAWSTNLLGEVYTDVPFEEASLHCNYQTAAIRVIYRYFEKHYIPLICGSDYKRKDGPNYSKPVDIIPRTKLAHYHVFRGHPRSVMISGEPRPDQPFLRVKFLKVKKKSS